jgi:hypothetical protein
MAPTAAFLPASEWKTKLPMVAVYLDGYYSHSYTVYFRPMPTRMEDLPWSQEFMETKYTLGPTQLHYTKVNHLNSHS